MMIIDELDEEGINLQETRLNFQHQGYGAVWDFYIGIILREAMNKISMEIMKEMMNEMNNPTAEDLIK